MPKYWKTQLPATRKTVSTTMHASDAISATRARPLPDTPSVNATNDGTTANGLTIVTRVMKDSRTTLDSGMSAADYGARRVVGLSGCWVAGLYISREALMRIQRPSPSPL